MPKKLIAFASNRENWYRLLPFGIVLGLWTALVTLFSLQDILVHSTPWTGILTQLRSFWLLWIFYLPIITWLSLRFPIEHPKILFQAGIHLAACAVIVTFNQMAYRTFLPLPIHEFDNPPLHQDAFPDHQPPPHGFRGDRHGMQSAGMRLAPDIVVYLLTMSACVAFTYFRRSQERERRAIELEARLTQAKLQALRMQINPHFLFNTLNAISTLVHTDPEAADDMITDLSELFRGSLESSDEQEIPLARELEFLQRYLSIEQRRFGNHLQIEQSVEPEILSALVPTFILQPLVENAVRHGVESQANVGKIAIRGKREGDSIRLSVSDNGKKPVVLSESNERSVRQGIGLTNARARLRQLYGNDQSLSIRQGDLGGWMIDIKLPYKFGSAEKVNL